MEAALARALDPHGGLLDTASPELASVRRRLTGARRAAADLLRDLAVRLRPHLQESFTTLRGGRPVLAVKASSRSAVPGIVHDSSGSGETIFVEPIALVEANNRTRELVAEEAAEQERILRALSRLAGEERETIDDLTGGALRARPGAGLRRPVVGAWNGCRVEPAGEVDLRAARHPLLDPATAVPIDLPLTGTRALVVSGPNTGGKTVALKTLGLLAMLHQCGLRVPAPRAPACRCSTASSPTSATTSRSPRACPPSRPTSAGSSPSWPWRGRARWCCSTSPPPAPTPTRARAWPSR